jgi:hypothetical protein
MAVRIEGLIFAGVGSADHEGVASHTLLGFLVDDIGPDGELNEGYGFRYRHFRGPDGRRFELLEGRIR